VGIKTLYLMRHAQYEKYEIPGEEKPGARLTKLGVQQAQLAARWLASRPIKEVYFSSLTRASLTAEILQKTNPTVPFHSSDLLWECHPISSRKARKKYGSMSLSNYYKHRKYARNVFDTFFTSTEKEEEHILLVSHGNLIRYLLAMCLEIKGDNWLNMGMFHTGVTVVQILEDEQVNIVTHNEAGHLPQVLQTQQ
jgi:broad specificity phosphatase PhoE